jgi:hypothetical protein
LPIYIAGGVLGVASAGVFLTIRSVTNAANVGLEIIENYFAARLAREYVSDPERYRKTLAELVIIVLLAWLVGLFLLHAFDERILAVVSSGRYTGFGGMLLAFWVANFAIFIFRIQAVHLRTTGRHVYIPMGYAVGAIVLVSSFALVFSVAGLQGLANAVVLGASAIAIFQTLIIWRRWSHES